MTLPVGFPYEEFCTAATLPSGIRALLLFLALFVGVGLLSFRRARGHCGRR